VKYFFPKKIEITPVKIPVKKIILQKSLGILMEKIQDYLVHL